MAKSATKSKEGSTERQLVERYFAPGGELSRVFAGYEIRPQQLEMALVVAEALRRARRAIVEAGTGVGKTLAYLIPAVLSNRITLVSTATKNLQEQIFFKDIPILEKLGLEPKAVYLKGRNNYLCLYRFQEFRRAPLFRQSEEAAHLDTILEWASRTATGDRAELSAFPDDFQTWADLSTTPESCLGSTCPDFEQCFVTRLKRRAASAKLLVINHHLFFADLTVRNASDGQVLPPSDCVIFDEAHHLEEIATSFFGRQVSMFRFTDLKGDLTRAMSKVTSPTGRLDERLRLADEALKALFQGLRTLLPSSERVELDKRVTADAGLLDLRRRCSAQLLALNKELEHCAPLGELAALFGRRSRELKDDLDFVLQATDSGWVYQGEQRGRGGRHVMLQASPIDLAPYFSEQLYPTHSTTVFTSATLAVGGEFGFFRSRIALDPHEPVTGFRLESPFDFQSQCVLYVPKGVPDPSASHFVPSIAPLIEELLGVTQGRAFVLCTSYKNMRELHERFAKRLPYPLLLQGERPKTTLIQQFRETPSVLLATSSFWEGVDVPGENLSLVIIDKLPFASPGDPVVKARINLIREQGGNPFNEYQLPQAALTLRQGFGRLIRRQDDRGIVAVFDTRLVEKPYGKVFLGTLPDTRLTRDLDEVRKWWAKSA